MSLILEDEIRRLALIEARNLVAAGFTVEQAAAQACHGHWVEQREWVEKELRIAMREVFGKSNR
jgi:hypothetical protein